MQTDITLNDIARFTELNTDNISNPNMQLNEIIWNDQSLQLEEKISRIQERFQSGNDAVRGQLLMDMNRFETILAREGENITRIQDPSEMVGRRGRTFGRGGSRRPTGGEIMENELRRHDGMTSRMRVQTQQSDVVVNNSNTSGRRLQRQ